MSHFPDDSEIRLRERSAFERAFMPGLLLLMLAGLWLTRPQPLAVSRGDKTTACLSNLNRIAAAFAMYARDFDGAFPRGTDAEDRFNRQTWCSSNPHGQAPYGGRFCASAKTAPLLPDLLLPYLKTHEVWRCPADVGFERSRLPGWENGLMNVKPSAFAKFGLSYSYFTIHGFAGLKAGELDYPHRAVILFDSDVWHTDQGTLSLNVMFADGHTQNLSSARFEQWESESNLSRESLVWRKLQSSSSAAARNAIKQP